VRSTSITTLAWTAALLLVSWQRLLKPALLAAFPGAHTLFVSLDKTHESRPSDPDGADLTHRSASAPRPARSAATPRRTRRATRPTAA
jgi:hypothetical protein